MPVPPENSSPLKLAELAIHHAKAHFRNDSRQPLRAHPGRPGSQDPASLDGTFEFQCHDGRLVVKKLVAFPRKLGKM